MIKTKQLLENLLVNLNSRNIVGVSKFVAIALLYLCDWKYSIEFGEQITDIVWKPDFYDSTVEEVDHLLEQYPKIFTTEIIDSEYSQIDVIYLNKSQGVELSRSIQNTVNFVLDTALDLDDEEFVKLIYSTFPLMISEEHEDLNLPKLAKKYKVSATFKNITPEFAIK